jgi:N-acetylglutamate synthase-like GNAT family acetyltransferase
MKIREYIETDYERAKEFAERNGLSFPKEGKMLIAEDDNGEIKSILNVRLVTMIEPMISENPVIGKKLFDYVEEKIKGKGIKIIRCFSGEKNIELYEKLGFYECFENHKILEKNFYSEV